MSNLGCDRVIWPNNIIKLHFSNKKRPINTTLFSCGVVTERKRDGMEVLLRRCAALHSHGVNGMCKRRLKYTLQSSNFTGHELPCFCCLFLCNCRSCSSSFSVLLLQVTTLHIFPHSFLFASFFFFQSRQHVLFFNLSADQQFSLHSPSLYFVKLVFLDLLGM